LGGSTILKSVYGGSPSTVVTSVYSEFEWLPWRFNCVPKGFWNDLKNQRNFMEWAAKQLDYKNMEDWYKISIKVK
jgi:hypothetical protein